MAFDECQLNFEKKKKTLDFQNMLKNHSLNTWYEPNISMNDFETWPAGFSSRGLPFLEAKASQPDEKETVEVGAINTKTSYLDNKRVPRSLMQKIAVVFPTSCCTSRRKPMTI